MSLRPELTLRGALAAMLRWWWVIAIVAIGFGIVARQVASSRQHGAYRATVTVREVEFDMSGSNGRYSLPRVVQPKVLPDPASYELSAAVANAAQALGVSQGIVRDAVSGKALDATEAQLAYDADSAAAARRGAAAYAAAYVKARQGEQISMLTTALNSVPAVADTSGGQDAHLAITNALAAVPNQITVGGDPSVEKQTASISPAAALLAGLMTGLATGVLLALALQRFDPRVRNASALDPADMDVYDSTPAGIAGLRVDLELSAVRPDGGVVAVVPTDDRRGVRASATELAHAFAAAGTPALVMDVAPEGGGSGVRSFLDGTDDALAVHQIGENLREVGAGASAQPDETLFSSSRVSDLLLEARKHADVVVIATAAVSNHPGSLLVTGLADGAVVVLRPASRWQDLDRSVERVRRAARTSLRLWFERKPLEPGARAASSRVEPAPVRASS